MLATAAVNGLGIAVKIDVPLKLSWYFCINVYKGGDKTIICKLPRVLCSGIRNVKKHILQTNWCQKWIMVDVLSVVEDSSVEMK